MTSTYVRDNKRVQVLHDDFDNDESDDDNVSSQFQSLIFSPSVI